jgi:hypothetical protein
VRRPTSQRLERVTLMSTSSTWPIVFLLALVAFAFWYDAAVASANAQRLQAPVPAKVTTP